MQQSHSYVYVAVCFSGFKKKKKGSSRVLEQNTMWGRGIFFPENLKDKLASLCLCGFLWNRVNMYDAAC